MKTGGNTNLFHCFVDVAYWPRFQYYFSRSCQRKKKQKQKQKQKKKQQKTKNKTKQKKKKKQPQASQIFMSY